METTDKSMPHLNSNTIGTPMSKTAAAKSAYRKNKNRPLNKSARNADSASQDSLRNSAAQDSQRKCKGCGRTSHFGKTFLKREECPAWGKHCKKCGVQNHFAVVCEQRMTKSRAEAIEDETSDEESRCDAAMFL